MKPTEDTLDDLIWFDRTFKIAEDGEIDLDPEVTATDLLDGEVHVDDMDRIDETGRSWAAPYGWDFLRGYSGQDRYDGAIMHLSETVSGGLARHILATPGYYHLVEVTTECRSFEDLSTRHEFYEVLEIGIVCDHEPAGWAVLYRPL